MTDVLMNVENIIDNYEEKNQEKDSKITKVEAMLIVYKIKKIVKSDYAQKIIKNNIIKDKTINEGRATIKGTRVTPEDIGRVIMTSKNANIKEIFEEYPSIETEEQILAGLYVFLKDVFTFKTVLFSK